MVPGGNALDIALTLQRAPLQRFELQGRPLPEDIGSAIQLAAGNPELLAAASARLGVAEAAVLEAVRFYLQQVLFAADADAWRTLGLAPGAAPERIRQHYRWLQSWLHPDRQDEEWVALYTTRVNQAWNRLRNPVAREAYAREQAAAISRAASRQEGVLPVGEWRAVPSGPAPGQWRSKLLVGASLGACALLLVLVLVRESAELVDRDPVPAPLTAASAGKALTDPEAARPASRTDSAPGAPRLAHQAQASRLLATTLREAAHAGTASTSSPSAPANSSAAPPAAPDATVQAAPPSTRAAAVTATAQAAPPPPGPVRPAARTRDALALAPSADLTPAEPVASETTPAAAPRPTAMVRDPVSLAAMPRAPVGKERPAAAPEPALAAAPLRAASPATRLPGRAGEANTATVAAARLAPPTRNREPVVVPVTPVAAPLPAPVEPVTRPIVPATAVASIQRPALAVPPSGTELVRRVDLAREQLRDIAGYFSRADATPADWRDAHARPHLEREHQALQRRRRTRTEATSFTLTSPRWRVSADTAAVDADYSVAGESGSFSVDMVWQDRAWHVTRIELRPAP